MRILITSVSALGHVHPMVPLALALIERGHLVRWLTGPDAVGRLGAVGIAADAVGPSFESLRAEYRRRYPEAASYRGEGLADHVFPRLFGEVAAHVLFPEIVTVTRAWRPELVIHDAAEFSGPIAAGLIGVPSVTHAFGALTPPERVAAAAERAAPLWRSVGLEPRPYGGLYDHLYLDIYPASLQTGDMRHVPRRQLLRPVAFDDAGDDADASAAVPGDGPLVYLTLGTVDRDRTALRTALEALAARRVRVLVTVGPAGDPASLGPTADERPRRNGTFPRRGSSRHCAVVVSHAGSGTFLATLAHGIPQLCLPQAADQFMNAAACARSGTGLVLSPDEVATSSVGEAVSRLLAERTFRDRASGVRGRDRGECPGPPTSPRPSKGCRRPIDRPPGQASPFWAGNHPRTSPLRGARCRGTRRWCCVYGCLAFGCDRWSWPACRGRAASEDPRQERSS